MKRATLILAALALLLGGVGHATAGFVTFNDLSNGQSVPTGYAGFNWTPNFAALSNSFLASYYGWTYGSPSGMQISNEGSTQNSITVTSAASFDFNGADFTGWGANDQYQSYTATAITVDGYNGANLVGSVSMNLRTDGYDFLTADFANVTELVFTASGPTNNYSWWLMTDFTYDEPFISSVPAPSSLTLCGTALFTGVGYFSWRRRKQIVVA